MSKDSVGKSVRVYAPEMIPLSLSDYRGEPACVIFFSGCNYNCGYCHNWALQEAKEEHLVSLQSIEEKIRGNSLITACKVSGGEPLLQAEALVELGIFVKSLGLKFGIDTNGTFPSALEAVMRYVDLVSLDLKTSLQEEEYSKISSVKDSCVGDVRKSLGILLASNAYADIRMVVIPGLNDSQGAASSLALSLRETGYLSKYDREEASITLMEFVPENARSEVLRASVNTSVESLRAMASAMRLPGVHITHRVLGSFVPA